MRILHQPKPQSQPQPQPHLINKAYRRCLKCVYNKNNISLERLAMIDHSDYIHVKNLRILMIEVYKTLNKLNPGFMWDMFQVKNTPDQLRMPLNLSLPPTSSKKFGIYSVVFRAAFIWNKLPAKIKNATTNTTI